MSKRSLFLATAAIALGLSPALASAATLHTYTGTVTAINGTSISFTAHSGTSYIADASNAKLARRFGAALLLSDIQTGDNISIRGSSTGNAIAATSIRDLSLQSHNGTFVGTVASVGSENFVLQSKSRGQQTVNIISSTKIRKNGQSAQFSDIAAGESVRVSGVWDRNSNNVAASAVTITMLKTSISGTLSGISGSTLTVTAKNGTVYTVDAASARIVRKSGAASNLSELKLNDSVQIRGTHNSGSTNITASYVRDMSNA